KGGDPFVFGRGGEEAQALAAAGVPFEVIPGITSAIAVPAYGGVPVTHRGLSTSFTVVTGHEDPWAATETDWDAVAKVGGTIVLLMGTATRAAIAERLMDGGLAGDTPVAAVTWGTRPEQSSLRTTLAGLADAPVAAPAVIVIGAVAALDLAWFEQRPLFGKRIQVTDDGRLAEQLRALGAEVIQTPAIEIVDVPFAAPDPATYDWVLFTSANAVERFVPALRDARSFGAAKVAAVGPATADALRRRNIDPDLVPDEAIADALLAALPDDGPARALFPCAAEARPTLPAGLRARGWTVDALPVYETRRLDVSPVDGTDAITFLSPSAVDALRDEPLPRVVVCIGPVTADAVGRADVVVADPHTVDGMVASLLSHLDS
ncbi:MAG TPA: bifunctional uroporphyrinogen-III C-methyltransferase/uroporphyrinogen-III synthase, partial [Acidimicrobiales bacterium]|nr:bifunctional uroporphyrinogen-III C-methyltransferase/uroporphyrinogen-III synthase [Acidimicrobiales bacterium]